MGAVSSGRVAGDLSLRLVDQFGAFGPAYRKWVRSRPRDRGVSVARMQLLGALHCNGPGIMSSISDELGVTRRNVTALVDALEEEGMVRRKPHPTDRRATVVELTKEGARRIEAGYDDHRQAVAELFDTLAEKDRRELLRLIGHLRESLREAGASAGASAGAPEQEGPPGRADR